METKTEIKSERMTIKSFVIRLVLYVIFGAVIPFAFLIWRCDLFSQKQGKTAIVASGWGLIAICFLAIFFIKMLKAIRKGMIFSVYTQIIDSITKTFIPLLIIIAVIYFVGNIQKELFQFLIVLFICNIPAKIIPIPRWSYENKIEEASIGISKIISYVKTMIGGNKK